MKENIIGLTSEEYLTTAELSERIKMAPGTIRNLVWKNKFKLNIHYLKPTPRKLLFIWGNVQAWMRENSVNTKANANQRSESLIHI